MSFADEVAGAGKAPGGRCMVADMLEGLDDDLAAEVRQVIADPRYATSAIVRALKARGLQASEPSMGRHRREACRCSRTT